MKLGMSIMTLDASPRWRSLSCCDYANLYEEKKYFINFLCHLKAWQDQHTGITDCRKLGSIEFFEDLLIAEKVVYLWMKDTRT
jgi:hypothetical protein